MSPVVLFAFLTAVLAAVAGWMLYRHAYTYPAFEGNTPGLKKSYRKVRIAGVAVGLAVAVEVILAGWFVPVSASAKPLLYVAATLAVSTMLGGLIMGYWRGRRKLTVS